MESTRRKLEFQIFPLVKSVLLLGGQMQEKKIMLGISRVFKVSKQGQKYNTSSVESFCCPCVSPISLLSPWAQSASLVLALVARSEIKAPLVLNPGLWARDFAALIYGWRAQFFVSTRPFDRWQLQRGILLRRFCTFVWALIATWGVHRFETPYNSTLRFAS